MRGHAIQKTITSPIKQKNISHGREQNHWLHVQKKIDRIARVAFETIRKRVIGIDDKVLVEIFLEGGSEFTSIVLDVGSGFDCQSVALLPTEVELQFHGSADVNEKDATFNYQRKYLPIQQISGMEQTSFLFQQAS